MKRLLLIPLSLLTSLTLFAAPVSERQASATAQAFFARHGIVASNQVQNCIKRAPTSDASQSAAWYAFNGDQQGFVIVSGDDRAVPVLGYSLSGTFDYDRAPDNLKAWLDGYAQEIAWLQEHNVSPTTTAKAPATDRQTIDPMVQTKWGQDEPFNNNCPDFFTLGKTVTGCVATAMAQVLYFNYQQHPSTITHTITNEIPAYTCSQGWQGYGYISVDAVKAGSEIDWANMLTEYDSNATTTQQDAVANLMAWCGASVEMNYANAANGGSGTGLLPVAQALINYFDFDPSTTCLKRESFTAQEWNDRVYEELAANRVVCYSGVSSAGSGHAFVINGYDGDNYFHVNWGWGGYCDGAFLLSVLAPESGGTGSGTVADGYNQQATIVVNAEPNHGGSYSPSICALNFTVSGTTISYGASNIGTQDGMFDYGLCIQSEGTLPTQYHYDTAGLRKPQGSRYAYASYSCDLSSLSLADGTYRVTPSARLSDDGEWQSLWSASRYLLVTVSNGQITIVERPSFDLTATDLTVGNVRQTGVACNVSSDITNQGAEVFEGTVYLFASASTTKGSAVATASLSLNSGATQTTTFSWVPSTAGAYTLWLCKDANGTDVIATGNVEIEEGTTSTGIISVTGISVNGSKLEQQYVDADGRIVTPLEGTAIEGKYTLLFNQSVSKQDIFVTLFKYDSASNTYSFADHNGSYITVTQPQGNTVDVNFSLTNLSKGKYKLKIAAGTFNASSISIDPEIWSNDQYCYEIGVTTDIDDINAAADAQVAIYSLSGIRVATVGTSEVKEVLNALPSGIYIVGGKKVMKK